MTGPHKVGHWPIRLVWFAVRPGRSDVFRFTTAIAEWWSSMTPMAPWAKTDPITEELLIGQMAKLELFQWFVGAHLDNAGG